MPKRTKQPNNTPFIPILLGVLLLAAGAVSLLFLTGSGIFPGSEPAATVDITYPDVQRVSLEDAKAALDAGAAVFLDVRGPGAYDAGHVPGALLVPIIDLDANPNTIDPRLADLDPQDWIITYCT